MSRGKLLWNPRKQECNWKQDALVVGVEPLTVAYAVLSLGTILSFVIFLIEISAEMKQKKFTRKNSSSRLFKKNQF